MQFANCTTCGPLFHDPYGSYESYKPCQAIHGSYICLTVLDKDEEYEYSNILKVKFPREDSQAMFGMVRNTWMCLKNWLVVLVVLYLRNMSTRRDIWIGRGGFALGQGKDEVSLKVL